MTEKNIEPDPNKIVENLIKMGLNTDAKKNVDKPSPTYENLLKNYKNAQHFQKAFNTPAGKKVLDALMDESLRKLSWHWAAENTDQAMMYGLMREGQNSLMKLILAQIALAESGPPLKKKASKP